METRTMPEAQKEIIQDEKLVPIDTSGDAVDVELEESKVHPVEEETTEQPQEATEDQQPEPVEQQTTDKSEHDKYSEKVKKRISTLVGKLREAERREEAAVEYANGLKDKQKELEDQLQSVNQNYASTMETASTSQVEEAKLRLRKAIEEGDVNAQADAQSILARASLDAERAKIQKEQLELQAQKFQQSPEPTPSATQQTPAPPPPDPKATAWAEKNDWFGKDEAMTYTAFAVHRKLVEQEGYDPRSDEYYEEIDRQIREQFPTKFEAEKSKKVVDQTVAPAVKSTSSKGNKRTVRLTPSQVAIAKKLGVPLEEYAKYVKE
tara:strand:- start:50 stop:1015 length:966 start_codon:yes stop_codon:yes gene_type:complete